MRWVLVLLWEVIVYFFIFIRLSLVRTSNFLIPFSAPIPSSATPVQEQAFVLYMKSADVLLLCALFSFSRRAFGCFALRF